MTRILVVEDSKVCITVAKRVLEMHYQNQQITIDIAQDIDKAFSLIKQNDYNYVILDIMMTHLSGAYFLTTIRNNKNHVPVGLMTHLSKEDTIVKPLLRKRNVYYIGKPLKKTILNKFLQDSKTESLMKTIHNKENNINSKAVLTFLYYVYNKKYTWKHIHKMNVGISVKE